MSNQREQLMQIATRLAALRDLSGYTQGELAEKLGVTPEEMAAYESGTLDIPVSILHAAAELMGVDLTELLTGKSPRLSSYCLVRKDQGLYVDRYVGYDFQSLAYNFVHRSAEPLLVTVGPENDPDNPLELVSHPGQEFNYVLEGTVRVTIGKNDLVLQEGDSLYFDPTLPHGQRAVGEKGAKFLTIIL